LAASRFAFPLSLARRQNIDSMPVRFQRPLMMGVTQGPAITRSVVVASFASLNISKKARPHMSSASAGVGSRALVGGVGDVGDVIGCTPQLRDMHSPARLHPRSPQPAIAFALYIL
jgi:hypothetical protein